MKKNITLWQSSVEAIYIFRALFSDNQHMASNDNGWTNFFQECTRIVDVLFLILLTQYFKSIDSLY